MPVRAFALATALAALGGHIAALAPGAAVAQTTPKNAHQSKLPASDQKLMAKLSQEEQAQIHLGRLAQKQAARQEVKAYGAKMAQEHLQAQQRLQSLATSKGTELPARSAASLEDMSAALQRLGGDEFDKRYLAMAGSGQAEALSILEEIERTTWDADLRRLAVEMAAAQSRHLVAARQLAGGAPEDTPGQQPATGRKK